ncbi:MAG: cation:proton antiporter [Labilithrix sp.]|nr:cation:proton antiporter [Labilithrix sp.]
MSAIALLMGLLVLSYLGSLLVGTGKTRGLASGIEFIGLGFAVGPHALGLVERPMITEFEPIVQVALGWLAFVVGLDFGRVEGRRVGTTSTALGIACAVITGLFVAVAVYVMLELVPVGLGRASGVILAAGAGAIGAETARNAVEWVQGRWGAKGPVSSLLVDIGAADDLAPLVAAGAIFAVAPSPGVALSLPAWGWFGAAVALGALLGTVTALLLRGAEDDAVWGALIGTLLLGVGVAARFGLSTIFVTFVMGIALAAASPSRRALRKIVNPTERAVLYPMLLLAGARLDPRPVLENRMLLALVALVLLARIFGKIVSGFVVRAAAPAARPAGAWLGIVLLSSGPVSTACGFVFALRFPGPVGDTLLLCAVASAVLGELVSTLSLKAMLTEAGEIVAAPASSGAVRGASVPPPPPSSSSGVAMADAADAADAPGDEKEPVA